jgi:serine/threonine-protein kinase
MIDIDQYMILGELGRGPRGVVYKARDRLTDCLVALKTIDPLREGRAASTLETAWFVSDALSAWRLTHPNIVTVYAAGDAGGKVYVAMELLKGHSLRRELGVRPLGILRSIRIAAETACGLAYAHEQGVVHRNLKPSNIIIRGDDGLSITDFGIGRIGDAAILSGGHARCLSYLSPEQIRGDQAIDGRSDIFSLGAVLYEMLTRRLPFNGGAPAKIMREVLEVEPPLPSELNPDVSPVLDGMVLSMLAKEPDDRAANVGIILRGLRRLEEELGEELSATACSTEVPAASALTAVAHTSGNRDETRLMTREPRTETRAQWRSAGVVLAVTLATATALSVWWPDSPDFTETQVSAISTEPATAIAPARSFASGAPLRSEELANDAPMNVVAAREPATSAVTTVSTATLESEPSVGAPAKAPAAKITPRSSMTRATQLRAKTGGGPPDKTATLAIAVSPWGAIYIDGKLHGTTPPITTLDLSPGKHRIEIRNPSQPAYLTYATVRAGEVRSIRHEFETRHEFQ